MALITLLIAATKVDMLEEVRRLKRENKEGMEKQEDLMASAKLLQGRIHSQNKVGISYFFGCCYVPSLNLLPSITLSSFW